MRTSHVWTSHVWTSHLVFRARQIVGVRVVADTVQITQDGLLLRTHRARHDKAKEFGALANPGGRPRRSTQNVA